MTDRPPHEVAWPGDDPGRPEPAEVFHLWLQIGAVLSVAILTFHRALWLPHVAAAWRTSSFGRPLGLFGATVASVTVAVGISLLAAITVLHRRRFRFVLRSGRARLSGALILAFLTPLAVYGHGPFLLGTTALFLLSAILKGGVGAAVGMLAIGIAALAIAFPISCLLVSGIHNRTLRAYGAGLIWFAAYSFHLLIFGNRHFVL